MKYFVTVSDKATALTDNYARQVAKEANLPFRPRDGFSLAALTNLPADGFFVIDNKLLASFYGNPPFRFHPGMARLRILGLSRGQRDRLLEVGEVQPGQRVLDCTAGLCSDSAVLNYAVGPTGSVVALESSLPVYVVILNGLVHYQFANRAEAEAFRNIKLMHLRYQEFLATTPFGTFDLIYFDPMFEQPITASSGIEALRPVASYEPLEPSDIRQALAVATDCVIVKGTLTSALWDALPPDKLMKSKGSRIVYGIYRP